MSTNEKPFTLQVFLPHKTTTGVVLEGFGVRVSATRSSVRAAVEDALKEWHQRVLDPLTKAARTTRAKLAQETTFPGPRTEGSAEEVPPGPLPDQAPQLLFGDHPRDGVLTGASAPVLGVPFEP